MLAQQPKALYASFDVFPAPKGAATHIRHMAETLFDTVSPGCLYVIGGEGLPTYQQEGANEIIRFSMRIENFLERTLAFSDSLSQMLLAHGTLLKIAHFRDPWSGFPILTHRHDCSLSYRTVYEINGLPSIELPYAYPGIAASTMDKIRQQEQFCLDQSDHIIVPAQTIKNKLLKRGVDTEKITVIPNGANIIPPQSRPKDAPDRYLIYSGALQKWQGIDDLLRSFALLEDFDDVYLVICASRHNRIAKQYRKLADKLNISDRLIWHYGMPQTELFAWLQHALLSVAPLTDCARNVEQGCAPLKILESMAAGVPVIASDLPPVREIMTDKVHGRLVRPGRPELLALTIRTLLDYPDEIKSLGKKAKQHIERQMTWNHTTIKLTRLYQYLLEKK